MRGRGEGAAPGIYEYARAAQPDSLTALDMSRLEEAVMATNAIESLSAGGHHTLSVARLLVTGAITGAAITVLCWIGTFLPYSSPTHAYISLFTNAEVSSGRALIEGFGWSLAFGGLSAGLFALVYNAVGGIGRR